MANQETVSCVEAGRALTRRIAPFERDRLAAPKVGAGEEIEMLVGRLLELLGEDPDRDGLIDTPARVAKSLQFLTRGYNEAPRDVLEGAIFQEEHGSMVVVRDIELYSLCEHHMLPFFGRAHIAYIPDGRIIGLSKLARLTDVFARRLQVQERLTTQIADGLTEVLKPKGVAVVIEASHLCMRMRGVEKQSSTTITSSTRGIFAECLMTRQEFFSLVGTPAR